MSRIKPINDLPGYCITTDGRVLSRGGIHVRWKRRRWKAQREQNSGYLIVSLNIRGDQLSRTVHRLVAKAFISNPENKTQVNHLDGNKHNNNVENLEWTTPGENLKHSYDINLRTRAQPHLDKYRGESHTEQTKDILAKQKMKISFETAKEIRMHIINKTMTYAAIRKKYKVGGGTMNMCRDNSFRTYNLETEVNTMLRSI